jgi:hypothetical protein
VGVALIAMTIVYRVPLRRLTLGRKPVAAVQRP